MYEIKSSTSVSKLHRYDATFQTLVFQKQYDLGDIYILHLNKDYVRDGEINLYELFTATNITEKVEELKDEVHMLRYEALEVLQQSEPDHVLACIRPKVCPCLDLCHPNLPEYSIYDINRLTGSEKKIRKLEEMGVKSVYDVPHNFPLSEKQRFQVDVAQSRKARIDIKGIKKDLEGLEYPLYFIDYETFNPALPMFDGYKPFDQMPFQWSLHIQEKPDSELQHFEFLETKKVDPIPAFLEKLQDKLGKKGSIIVWNATFEGTQNKRMGEIHPRYKDFCEDMNSRMYDLMDIFRDAIYADPKLKGSYSIKKVLPVLVPELSYEDMDIGDGATAMASWQKMVYEDSLSEKERENIRISLLKYCELDTLAMVEIFHELIILI